MTGTVLLIGGTRYIGHHLTERLLADGHSVTLLHRGRTPSAFGPRVREVLGDRAAPETWMAVARGSWDLVVDLCSYVPAETRAAIEALSGRVGRFVHVSTGQVYLVLDPVPIPAKEADSEGRLMTEPAGAADREAWAYGLGKRDCEAVLFDASTRGFPATILRLPVVQGPLDAKRRLHAYVRRILDGGPLLLPPETKPLRHLFVKDFAACVSRLLGSKAGFGRAYNLSMDDSDVTLLRLIEEAARALGREASVLTVDADRLTQAKLEPEQVSPLSGSWVSYLDSSAAAQELEFEPTPWKTWLAETVRWHAELPEDPLGYERRALELELAHSL